MDYEAEITAILAPVPELQRRALVTIAREIRVGSQADLDMRHPLGEWALSFATVAIGSAMDHLQAWAVLFGAGGRPTFAHMTLLRVVFEGLSRARWLLEADVAGERRIARGVGEALEDYRQQANLSQALRESDPAVAAQMSPDPPLAAELRAEAAATGIVAERLSATDVVAIYGPGRVAYRSLAPFAHAALGAPMRASERHELGRTDGRESELATVVLDVDLQTAMHVSRQAVLQATVTLAELDRYLGNEPEAERTGSR